MGCQCSHPTGCLSLSLLPQVQGWRRRAWIPGARLPAGDHLVCAEASMTAGEGWLSGDSVLPAQDHPSWLIEPWGMAAAAPKSLQLCPTLCDPIDGSPPGTPVPAWDSPGKNTGVGCHLLLQCMKVKSESEVSQLCLILSNPMDCSLPGSSIHGIFQARVLEWGAIAFSVGHGRPP